MLIPPTITDNRIINGDFLVTQRNEKASITPSTTNTYIEDMWKFQTSGLGSSLSFQVQSTTILNNSANAMLATVAANATPTSTQYALLTQVIEGINVSDLGYGLQSARNVILSFQAISSLTGNFCVSIRNSATNGSYVTTFNIPTANKWFSFDLSIPGDTSGTWLKSIGTAGLIVSFDLGSGSSFQGTANTWTGSNITTVSGAVGLVKTASATFGVNNVRLSPTFYKDVNYSPRPYAIERDLCRRFFQKTFADGTAPAQNAGVAGAITVKNPIASGVPSEWWRLSPMMASAPTVTTYNPSNANANWRDITAAADVTVSVDPATTVGVNGVLIATSGPVTTLGDILAIHATADAGL